VPSSLVPVVTMDKATLTGLIRDYTEPLLRHVTRLTFNDLQLAEDIVQETFLKVWQRPDVVNHRYSSIRPWLFTVARNLVNDHKRMRMARAIEVSTAELITVSDQRDPIGDSLQAQAIWQAVAQLTPHHQAVLVQVYGHDRSLMDAAKRLGIPIGTVKSRTHHALRSLQTMLGEGVPAQHWDTGQPQPPRGISRASPRCASPAQHKLARSTVIPTPLTYPAHRIRRPRRRA
jgi:RNA polymerase sigma-70 factor, ECF subfamily